jgi:microcin C transport system substrate-binding protein
LAEGFEPAADKLSMTVTIPKNATFSDGKPVTAEDVVFSFKTFQTDKVAPFYKFYWTDIKEVKAEGPQTVKMVFAKVNPELPLISTQMPILPKHVYEKGDFASDYAQKAVGSGPYVVKDFKAGSFITLKKNPNFWGKDAPQFRGRYNFDEITIKFYKDATAMVEAFKKGDFDVYTINSSKVWALDVTGDRIEKLKWIKKELWPNSNGQGSQGFAFNLRLPIFQDVRVREALALAFDFEWSNKNLFYGQYTESASFFENSPLKAKDMPSPEELAILEPLKGDLSPDVFTKPMGWLGKGQNIKDRLRMAMGLLKEAGYTIKDGVAQGPAGKLEFKFLIDGPGFARIVEPWTQNLAKLGAKVTIEEKEQSVYVKRVESREFDMIVASIGESQSPGNEQRDYWTSAAADQNHSRNYPGIKNKAIDALVDRVIYSKDRAELELNTRCLDRALYHVHSQVHGLPPGRLLGQIRPPERHPALLCGPSVHGIHVVRRRPRQEARRGARQEHAAPLSCYPRSGGTAYFRVPPFSSLEDARTPL